jgi:hypothetical protein
MGLSGHQLGCVEAFVEGDPLLFSERVLNDPRRVSRYMLGLLRLLVALELGFEFDPLCSLGLSFVALIQERADGDETPCLWIARPAIALRLGFGCGWLLGFDDRSGWLRRRRCRFFSVQKVQFLVTHRSTFRRRHAIARNSGVLFDARLTPAAGTKKPA